MMTLGVVRAVAAVLTLIWLMVRQRLAFATTSNSTKQWKSRKIEAQVLRSCVPSRGVTHCSQQTSFFDRPKYKRDPEINIDNEEIGQCPCEDY